LAGNGADRAPGGRPVTEAEIAIVGAGPAGLSAALYAARFCRSTLVLHDGAPNAARIPLTRNVPGCEDGIAGPDLLEKMARHAAKYGAQIVEAHVVGVTRDGDRFGLASDDGRRFAARAVILATGLELNQIALDDALHERAIELGVLRYCPVCDGYEHRGQRVAVVGCDASGAGEALFLRQFTADVTLLARHDVELTARERSDLAAAGVRTVVAPVSRYVPTRDAMQVYLDGRADALAFDVVYPAFGCRPRNTLAAALGLPLTEVGKLQPEAPFGAGIEGLYGAGDLVEGLDQISVAMGQGAVAATRAHNGLRERDGHTAAAVIDTA
jgi:thioredoxin reductase (NADPH)